MITRGLGTNNLVTRGYGSFLKKLFQKIQGFVMRITTQVEREVER